MSSLQTDVTAEEDSDDDSSSSSSHDLGSDLEHFRREWFQELHAQSAHQKRHPPSAPSDVTSEAQRLFVKGVEAEREGKSGEAVYWYRRATHLCPDVERTITVPPHKHKRRRFKSRSSLDSTVESTSTEISHSSVNNANTNTSTDLLELSDSEQDEENEDLLVRFRALGVGQTRICAPEWSPSPTNQPPASQPAEPSATQPATQPASQPASHESDTRPATPTPAHISHLPTEILIRIIRWVVGRHVDIRSLDNLALTCRGFYVLARDDQVWARVCRAIWKTGADKPGTKMGGAKQRGVARTGVSMCGAWREMYMTRPRVHFNGCYISKTSYVREGEHSVDGFYHIVNIVEYYRYMRFFPNGRVVMVTSPEEPSIMVYKLLHSGVTVHGLLDGYYRLTDDTITIILKRRPINYNKRVYLRPGARRALPHPSDNKEDTYHIQLMIKNCGRRLNYALMWHYYCIHTVYGDGTSNDTVFDMTHQKYPTMYFSPVRSYCARSNGPV